MVTLKVSYEIACNVNLDNDLLKENILLYVISELMHARAFLLHDRIPLKVIMVDSSFGCSITHLTKYLWCYELILYNTKHKIIKQKHDYILNYEKINNFSDIEMHLFIYVYCIPEL